jgi:hypothetical protein
LSRKREGGVEVWEREEGENVGEREREDAEEEAEEKWSRRKWPGETVSYKGVS